MCIRECIWCVVFERMECCGVGCVVLEMEVGDGVVLCVVMCWYDVCCVVSDGVGGHS